VLKGNLSTRPFYNERLATLVIVLVAGLAVLLTFFNATELVRLSSARRATQATIASDQQEAARIRGEATALQQSVDRVELGHLAVSTREANSLIDQRTFSWTAFIKLIEKTLPADVRLVMVSPRVEQGTFTVAMDVVARSLADVATFIEALRGTGAFYDAAPISQQPNDDGTYTATVQAGYLPETSAAPAAPSEKRP
jgi:hypothetical protein